MYEVVNVQMSTDALDGLERQPINEAGGWIGHYADALVRVSLRSVHKG